jgi:hypothetical protein
VFDIGIGPVGARRMMPVRDSSGSASGVVPRGRGPAMVDSSGCG